MSKWWSRGRRPVKQRVPRRAMVEPLEDRLLMAVFTVVNTADSGVGSLRSALDLSNSTPGIDTIAFNISAADKTIHIASQLPGVYDAAIVDGTTQPGYAGRPLVRVDGAGTDGNTDGFKLFGNSTLKGLSVTGFGGQGVTTIPRAGYNGNTISNNWIGLDLSGNAAGNKVHGIGVYTSGNTVNNNIVSSNAGNGIFVLGNVFGVGLGANLIKGNWVGVDPTGKAARGNGSDGIALQESPNNSVINNVSDASGHDGILLTGAGTSNNIVKGNIVGLDGSGANAIGNNWYGIEVSGPSNTIGGTAAGDRNIFSASGFAGIVLYTPNCHDNTFQGNYVGTDITGTLARGNVQQGIAVTQQGSPAGGANVIGGAGAGNLVAGNVGLGIGVFPGIGENISGNVLGKDVNGRALANGGGDLFVSSDSKNIHVGANNGPLPGGTVVVPAPVLQSAVSRRIQGQTAYDIPLPLTGATGIECRALSGGVTVVLTFDRPIATASAAIAAGNATLLGAATPSGNAVFVNLGSVGNAQSITVSLTGVTAVGGSTAGNASLTLRTLEGDVTGNGIVSGADVNFVKINVGVPVDATNFRSDVSANGVLSGADVNFVKINVGASVAAAASAPVVAPAVVLSFESVTPTYSTSIKDFLKSSAVVF